MTSDDFSSQAKKLNQSDYAQRPTKSLFLQYKAKKSLLVLVIPLGKNQGERAIFIIYFSTILYVRTSPKQWGGEVCDLIYQKKKMAKK